MFVHHFWGEKHNGFEVLSSNLKHGEQSCRDLEDFVKQLTVMEEQYVKSLARIIKTVGSYSTSSSFSPIWQAIKTSLEKLSSAHSDLIKRWHELNKDIHKYLESLGKKHKTLKDSQSATLEAVQSMQAITNSLAKSKESYSAKFNDYKKVLSEKTNAKKIERSESEFKKATEEYKTNVTKYNSSVDEYKRKMTESTEAFQEHEVEHLSQLEQFIQKFSSVKEEKHTEIGELHYEFHSSLSGLSVESLLDTFVETKGTGADPPGIVDLFACTYVTLHPSLLSVYKYLVSATLHYQFKYFLR